ncbi:MAG TPA: M3 family metallopeptidase [Alphaproteobacteria bacterium]|nr:M3 family metallopeptidase [Alphaproteobacteria bacterium]
MSDNILLTPSTLPYEAPPFDKIKEDDYLPAVKAAIEEARKNITAIKECAEEANFENTIVALEAASDHLGTVSSIFYNQLSAAGTDKLESLAEEIGPITANFSSDVSLDADLFARVKAVYDKKDDLGLNVEEMTLLDDTYKGFVRGGALLPEEKKKRLREISEKMSTLGPSFMNNAKKSSEAFELVIDDEKDLSGLPENAIAAAKHMAEEKGYDGKWLITLDYPSYGPFMTFADNRDLRERVWRAFASRAYGDDFDNCKNILTIVSLRDERAKLLGYKNHADFVLERRMAKTPENVLSFLEKLLKAYKPAAEKELAELNQFAATTGFKEELKPWDVGYFSEKYKQKLFDYSSEELRPYFQLEKVLDGVFTHFSKLFGLSFKPADNIPTWHKDVTAYEVSDKNSGKSVGLLYADFYPRTGKKSGAWKTSYRDQGLHDGKMKQPIVAIVCNFTKPTKDTPSLISFDEVTTLFHEMGHAIHALLSNVTYSSHAGTSVLWDFVELPSQVQENWAYKKETLDLFAAHYKTGEKIPEALIDKVNKAKNFMVGMGGLRQISFGLMDMRWHTADPSTIKDVAEFEDKATADSRLFPRLAGPMSPSFSHIFAGGYAAGYYSYKWAEVLDADTFELFEEKGLYDTDTAQKYKNEILSRGGSEPPEILYRRFRGRDADPNALLRREGLLEDKAA